MGACGSKKGVETLPTPPRKTTDSDLTSSTTSIRAAETPPQKLPPAPVSPLSPPKPPLKTRALVFTDAGADLDDEMALLLAKALIDADQLSLEAVVCTLHPAKRRAQLVRGTLDALGLSDVPVVVGSDGGDSQQQQTAPAPEDHDYIPGDDDERTKSLKSMSEVHELLERVAPHSISIVILASLKDAAALLKRNERLFVNKVRDVTIMGGVRWPVSEYAEPDSAHNNSFDMEASEYFYRRCQDLGVPLIVVGRDACYEVAAPKTIYEELGNTESAIGKRLRDAAHQTIDDLRRRAASTGPERRGLPARCDAQWFADNFCHGNPEVLVRPLQESVWDLVVAFNLYDVVALALAVPLLREAFVSPQCVVEVNGVSHCFVGCAPGAPAFRNGKARRACAKLVAEGPLKGHATRCSDGDIPAMRDSSLVFTDGKLQLAGAALFGDVLREAR